MSKNQSLLVVGLLSVMILLAIFSFYWTSKKDYIGQRIQDTSSVDSPRVVKTILNWNYSQHNLNNDENVAELVLSGTKLADVDYVAVKDLFDVIIPIQTDISKFLHIWKPVLEKYHLIIIQYGENVNEMNIPLWAHYDLYNWTSILTALGPRSWIFSNKDESIQSFGFLISDRKFVLSLNPCNTPTFDSSGKIINPIASHLLNLLSLPIVSPVASTVVTQIALSFGEFTVNNKLGKSESRIPYIVPVGQYFEAHSHNFAFDRLLIGPALFQDMAGDASLFGSIGHRFTGWAAKAVADHLRLGVMEGAPLVKIDNTYMSLLREGLAEHNQSDPLLNFFRKLKISSDASNAITAYRDIATQMKSLLPTYSRLAEGMLTWLELWELRNVPGCEKGMCPSKILPVSTSSSMGPKHSDTSCALMTITHNEKVMLPIWIRYYGSQAHHEDIYILDHNSNDGSTDPQLIPKNMNLLKLYGDAAFMPHFFLNRQVERYQQRLLRAGYKCVVFTEIDEIIIADPDVYKGGLREYLAKFKADDTSIHVRPLGFEILHIVGTGPAVEPAINWSRPLLQQRHFWAYSEGFSKPYIVKIPLQYVPGFHTNQEPPVVAKDPHLRLAHLHSIDYDSCMARERKKHEGSKKMHKDESFMGIHFGSHFEDALQKGLLCEQAEARTAVNRSNFDGTRVGRVEAIDKRWHSIII